MGRIKTSFIKHTALELFEKHSEKFSTDFEKNKEVVKGLIDIKSKKIRNMIAGFITSFKKSKKH